MIRYRHNITCLTTDQLHDLREAWALLYTLPAASRYSYLTIAGIHGMPAPSYCIHGAPGFLTWHRAYLLAIEGALQCVNPDVTLPYWNWSSGPTTGLPPACSSPTYVNRKGATVDNPLYSGPLPPGGPGTWTTRRPDIDTTSFGDLATSAQNAMTNTVFESFQDELNGAHGGVHVRVGGNMGSVPYAGFDPIFYMHHANVDRLWAAWQQSHPGALPPAEAGLSLDPFTRPCSGDLYTGADMETTDALGYRYLMLCLIYVGPFRLKPLRVRVEPWLERFTAAKLVFRSARMPLKSVELRVFVNQPDAGPRTPIRDNPNFAGSLGLFGMGGGAAVNPGRGRRRGMPTAPMPGMARGDRFDLQLDIVAALRAGTADKGAATLSFVPVGPDGKAAGARDLSIETVELHVG
jgi:hypothetical protein